MTQTTPGVNCTDIEEEERCSAQESCYWHYNGLGIEYQVNIMHNASCVNSRVIHECFCKKFGDLLLNKVTAESFSSNCVSTDNFV